MSSSTNERSIRNAKDNAKRIVTSNRGVLLNLMSSPQGRTWMWTYLGQTGMYRADESNDHMVLARNAGARNIGLRMTDELVAICPQFYIQMLVENSSANFSQDNENSDD